MTLTKKTTLDEYMIEKKKYTMDFEARIENSARNYTLVLQHFPPDLEAELQNHANWAAGQRDQNSIYLLLMIRDMTHNMKENKQGTMKIF